jgi:hypothetical protein
MLALKNRINRVILLLLCKNYSGIKLESNNGDYTYSYCCHVFTYYSLIILSKGYRLESES